MSKAGIKRDVEHMRAKASLEAARDVEFARKQYGSRIRRPPENGLIIVIPGKDALSVGFQ
jgi:hypothetical protein